MIKSDQSSAAAVATTSTTTILRPFFRDHSSFTFLSMHKMKQA